jgi:preprotein translocase subunit SecE
VSTRNSQTKVTRITASEQTAAPKKSSKPAVKKRALLVPKKQRSFGILGKIGGYFKGAWIELRQVHWPTRRATWGLTGAVLAFSAFFVAFIMLLDAGFKFVFEQILK